MALLAGEHREARVTEILFVHGALVRDGDWWWRPVAELLDVRSRAVLLPTCGEGHEPGGGLAEDAAALGRALDAVEGPAIVVGHSYGGTVVAEGADRPAAAHLLYISSYLPEVGTAQGQILSAEPDPVRVSPGEEGRVRVDGLDEAGFAARFLQDVDEPAVIRDAWRRVTEQGIGAFTTPTTRAAWQGRDSTYLVCADDRSTSLALQRAHAAKATTSVELPTGHHPFLSRPDLVAAEVRRILAELSVVR